MVGLYSVGELIAQRRGLDPGQRSRTLLDAWVRWSRGSSGMGASIGSEDGAGTADGNAGPPDQPRIPS